MVTFEVISPADFFYRNRDIAGFTNPARAIFSSVRELMENALDASDMTRILPEIYMRLSAEEGSGGAAIYWLRIMDNGSGIPARHVPSAFGQVLFGSKFKLKQARGTFGLGGTMAILYGQITTHKPANVASSTGTSKIYEYKLMIDIQRNRPIILDRKIHVNKDRWHGTVVNFCLEGDYIRAMPKILEYLKQTAVVNPYANIAFVDPKGRLYKFTRVTTKMPPPPKETLPHPYGVDVETIQRLTRLTKSRNMLDFMRTHFHRVGENISLSFLEYIGFIRTKDPKMLKPEEVTRLVQAMQSFKGFPKGVDVETIQRLTRLTKSRNMLDFMRTHFHRVGENISLSFLEYIGFIRTKDPKMLKPEEVTRLVQAMQSFKGFPKGVDVETIQRLTRLTKSRNMLDFMRTHFPKVPESVSLRLLQVAGFIRTKDPRKLKPDEIVRLVQMMKRFKGFLPPDASCLSPLGEELLEAGILKELNPEFIAVHQRKPSTYSGHPFIVETAIAYGGNVPKKGDFALYRFANRIPLLYDETSDVSWKIIKSINWRRYKATSDMPIAILVHLCSTKVPYKTVGKEYIADRPEVKREILNGLREVARQLKRFLSRREHVEKARRRLITISKYLPKIAAYSTELAGKEKPPDIEKLLKSVKKFEED